MEAKFLCLVIFTVSNCLPLLKANDEPHMCELPKDENLQERMIRTEVKVEAMLSEMRKTEARVFSALEQRRKDVQTTLTEIKESQAIQQTRLDKTRSDVCSLKEDFSALLQGSVAQVPIVAFQAYYLKDIEIKNGQTLIFTKTVYDKGSGYNNETGVYTVPISGAYFFSLQMCIYVNQYVYVEIVHEDLTIMKVRLVDEVQTYHSCSTVSGVAVLNRGERVWVKSMQSSAGTNVWRNTEAVWNSFSGVLINTSD